MGYDKIRDAADHMQMRTHGGDLTLLAFVRPGGVKTEGEESQIKGLCEKCHSLINRELDLIQMT
jgi:hypothetical protein